MQFCDVCDMRLYLNTSIGEGDVRKCGYSCLVCHKIKEFDKNKDEVVMSTQLKNKEETEYQISKYYREDCALPRLYDIQCINEECKSRMPPAASSSSDSSDPATTTTTHSEIAYIETNASRLEYLYICCVCDTQWTLTQH